MAITALVLVVLAGLLALLPPPVWLAYWTRPRIAAAAGTCALLTGLLMLTATTAPAAAGATLLVLGVAVVTSVEVQRHRAR